MTARYHAPLAVLLVLSVAPMVIGIAASQITKDPGIAWSVVRYLPLLVVVWAMTAVTVLYGVVWLLVSKWTE
ncbi:MAG: hypothetical protein AAFV43_01670 [Planctomycetota bacterium]